MRQNLAHFPQKVDKLGSRTLWGNKAINHTTVQPCVFIHLMGTFLSLNREATWSSVNKQLMYSHQKVMAQAMPYIALTNRAVVTSQKQTWLEETTKWVAFVLYKSKIGEAGLFKQCNLLKSNFNVSLISNALRSSVLLSGCCVSTNRRLFGLIE